MPRTYRVAIIGHTGRGNYGHGLDRVWTELPECQIVGVADADEKGRAEAARRLQAPKAFADYRQLLDQTRPDVVSIGPRWLDQHRAMVLAAAERRVHIYLEKPMCRDLAEADEMVAACERTGTKLAIAFQTRYSPKLQVVRDLIFEGHLGDLLELRGRGKEDARGGGEDLWVLGSHVINLVHHFGGDPQWCFATVRADGHRVDRRAAREGNEGIGPLVGDQIDAMYGLEHATAYFASKRGTAGGRFGLRILGSKGALDIVTGYLPAVSLLADPSWSPGRSGKSWTPVSSAGIGRAEPLADGGLHAGNLAACRDLLAAIEDDRLPEANIYEARTTVEMIAAVFASNEAQRPVTIPLADRRNPLGPDAG